MHVVRVSLLILHVVIELSVVLHLIIYLMLLVNGILGNDTRIHLLIGYSAVRIEDWKLMLAFSNRLLIEVRAMGL